MEISFPNENGVFNCTTEEIVARHGRSYASVNIALCNDGLYRQSVSIMYSYGGYFSPIGIEAPGCPTLADARTAGMEELLRRWPTPFQSDPKSVHEELAEMRQQIVNQLQQPTFL